MRVFVSFILFIFYFPASAQNVETDSLKKELTATTDPNKRVVILEGLSFAYVSTSPEIALQYANEGLELAQKNNYLAGEALCLNALGNVFFSVGDYAKALEMYNRNLEIKEQIKQSPAVTYFNMANVYTEQQDHRHALDYIFKTKKADEENKDTSGILFDMYSLSCVYLRLNDYDSAIYYGQQAESLAKYLQDKNLVGAIHNNFGEIYRTQNNLSLATKYFQTSIPYAEAITDNEVLGANYSGLAKIYNQQGKTDSAIFFTKKALSIAQEGSFLKQVFENSGLLSELFKNKKQFDSAFKYQELNVAMKDSVYNVENLKKIQNYKLLEQQKQQAIETAAMKTKSQVKLYSVIFILIILLVITVFLWRNNKERKKDYAALELQKAKTDHAYKELKSTQAQLVQSEKMASLGELTAGIAHEIQNPLNFVNNFSEVNNELLKELEVEKVKHERDEQLEEDILNDIRRNNEKISHHGKRAEAIVKGMLQHSQSSGGQKELTDINTIAEEYLHLAYRGFQAKEKSLQASLHADLDKTIGRISIVPQDIGRVLLNIYNNAFYAVYEKQKTAGKEFLPTVTVKTKKRYGKTEIRIADNGNGMPPTMLDKIFQPFYTTKPTGQGTGLGLSLAYDIVKAHGGELNAESQENEGATFIILI